jgi:hypothetical protein
MALNGRFDRATKCPLFGGKVDTVRTSQNVRT